MSLTPEQLEIRRSGIGGSEIASLLGLSPWGGPLDVWRAKDEPPVEQMTQLPHQRLGDLLEPVIATLYAEKEGCQVREVGTLRHPTRPLVLATPDRLCMANDDGEQWLLECKSSVWSKREEWGEPGTDAVPPHYLLQVQWTMAVTGLERADVAVLFGGQSLYVYRVAADPDLQTWMMDEAEAWWARHVVTGDPPPVDGSEATARWLGQRYQQTRKALLEATPEAVEWARQYAAAKQAKEAAEALERHAGNALRSLIGEDEGIQGEGLRVTWKADKNGKRTLKVKVDSRESAEEAA